MSLVSIMKLNYWRITMKLLTIIFIIAGILLADTWFDWAQDLIQERMENMTYAWYGRFSNRINNT